MKDLLDLVFTLIIYLGFPLFVLVVPIVVGESIKEHNQILAGLVTIILVPIGYIGLWKILLFLDKLTNSQE